MSISLGASPILRATRHYYWRQALPTSRSAASAVALPAANILPEGILAHSACGHCGCAAVELIALQVCVSFQSGDFYYDYEMLCRECRQFTAFTYCADDADFDVLWATATRTPQEARAGA